MTSSTLPSSSVGRAPKFNAPSDVFRTKLTGWNASACPFESRNCAETAITGYVSGCAGLLGAVELQANGFDMAYIGSWISDAGGARRASSTLGMGAAFRLVHETESDDGSGAGCLAADVCPRSTAAPPSVRPSNKTETRTAGPQEAGPKTASSESGVPGSPEVRVSHTEITGKNFTSIVYSSRNAAGAAAVIDHSPQRGG